MGTSLMVLSGGLGRGVPGSWCPLATGGYRQFANRRNLSKRRVSKESRYSMPHPLVDPRGRWMRDVLTDEEVVARVVAGEGELFELLMRRHNQRLFRTVRAMTRDDDAAEEALQRAYVAAWQGLSAFEGRATFATWITRIALNMVGESASREQRAADLAADAGPTFARESEAADEDLSRGELRAILERAIDDLPAIYRVVFVMRAVEGMSTAEVAHALDL